MTIEDEKALYLAQLEYNVNPIVTKEVRRDQDEW